MDAKTKEKIEKRIQLLVQENDALAQSINDSVNRQQQYTQKALENNGRILELQTMIDDEKPKPEAKKKSAAKKGAGAKQS